MRPASSARPRLLGDVAAFATALGGILAAFATALGGCAPASALAPLPVAGTVSLAAPSARASGLELFARGAPVRACAATGPEAGSNVASSFTRCDTPCRKPIRATGPA
jgi:alkylation response protein AidB-like acyl-CoA dehydrogenase